MGGRLEYSGSRGEWSLAASALASTRDDRWTYVGAADGELRAGPLELSAELEVVEGAAEDRNLWGGYLQAVYELLPAFHLVGRYEHFAPSAPGPSFNLGDLGVLGIPSATLPRADFRVVDHPDDEEIQRGFKASFSLLF